MPFMQTHKKYKHMSLANFKQYHKLYNIVLQWNLRKHYFRKCAKQQKIL